MQDLATFKRIDDQDTGRPDSHIPIELDVASILPQDVATVPLDDTGADDVNLLDSSPSNASPSQSFPTPRWSLDLFNAGPAGKARQQQE